VNLSDALDTAMAENYRPATQCSIAVLLERLDPDVAAKLITAIDTPSPSGDMVPATLIAQLLKQHGEPVAATSISRHRRRAQGNGCKCPS
jgi:hypothetical protein